MQEIHVTRNTLFAWWLLYFKKKVALSFCCHFRGSQNVMGVEACIRHKDHVVIVMPYFHQDKFQVHIVKLLHIILYYEFVNTTLKYTFTVSSVLNVFEGLCAGCQD